VRNPKASSGARRNGGGRGHGTTLMAANRSGGGKKRLLVKSVAVLSCLDVRDRKTIRQHGWGGVSAGLLEAGNMRRTLRNAWVHNWWIVRKAYIRKTTVSG